MFVPCQTIPIVFHKGHPLHILLPQAVDDDMGVDVPCVIVAVCVRDDQGLVAGKEIIRKLLCKSVSPAWVQIMILYIPWIKTNDVVVRHDVAVVVILIELLVQHDTFRVESEGVAVHAALKKIIAQKHMAGVIAKGFVSPFFTFEDQVLLDVRVVLLFDCKVFKNCQADHLPA